MRCGLWNTQIKTVSTTFVHLFDLFAANLCGKVGGGEVGIFFVSAR